MAIEHLRIPGAAENPLSFKPNQKQLPKSRPTLEFPVVTDTPAADAAHAGIILTLIFVCCVAMFYFSRALADGVHPIVFVLAVFLLSPLFSPFSMTNPHRGLPVRYIFLGSTVLLAAVGSIMISPLPPLLLGLAAASLLREAWDFRKHYIYRATAGMLDEKTIQDFRCRRRIPKGLRPKSIAAGFSDALVSYLTYNRAAVRVPGVLLSPAGGYIWRLGKTFSLLCLLTVSLTSQPCIDFLGVLFPNATHATLSLLAHPLSGLTLWLGANFLATLGFVGKAYALKCKQMSPNHWRRLIDRIGNSPDPIERHSVFLALVDCDRSPILYPIKCLLRHAWIVGKTGSGKTAYLMSLVDQLIRRDVSVVYIDLKAITYEVLAAMQHAAEGAPKYSGQPAPVKHFTLADGQSTYLFDIFSQPWWLKLPPPQRAGVVLSTLALAYSRAYGESWFTDAVYDVTLYVFKRHPDIKSWHEFARRLQDAMRHAKPYELSDDVKRDGNHVALIAKRLGELSAFNDYGNCAPTVLQNAIDFSNAFRSPHHYYFAVSSIQNGMLAGEAGRLVISSLLNAACALRRRPTNVMLVIDEFPNLLTQDLELLLTQARGLGIGVVLANQTTAQLVTGSTDLRPIVEGNTSVQAWMQITDDVGREQMRRLGGQQIVKLTSKHVTDEPDPRTSYTYTEHIIDRVPSSLVSEVGSHPRRFMLRVTDNEGYACYGDLLFVARSMFHQTKKAYDACCAMPWPAGSVETLINGPPPQSPPPPSTASPAVPKTPQPGHPSASSHRQTHRLGPRSSRRRP